MHVPAFTGITQRLAPGPSDGLGPLEPADRCWVGGCPATEQAAEYALYGSDQAGSLIVGFVTEHIAVVDGPERPSGTDINVGDFAVIEADRDQPWFLRRAQPHLLGGEVEFLNLPARRVGNAGGGKAGKEYESPVTNCPADFKPPVV